MGEGSRQTDQSDEEILNRIFSALNAAGLKAKPLQPPSGMASGRQEMGKSLLAIARAPVGVVTVAAWRHTSLEAGSRTPAFE